MKNSLLISEAEYEAKKLTGKLMDAPICPFKIAEEHKITVQSKESDNPGVSGFLMRVGNQFGIMHASNIKSEGFIRFTIAHELGHYFIPGHSCKLFGAGDGIHLSRSGFVSQDPLELQADHFAKELLMPESLFQGEASKAGEGFAAIESLSQKFNTSITATAIRYCTFAENAVIVIMSSDRNIEWGFMSPVLSDLPNIGWIKKGSLTPPKSYTHGFNKDKGNITTAKKIEGWTNLSDWLEDAPEIEMKEDVIGLGSYGKTLTILFTAKTIDTESENCCSTEQ
jgi:Zn-dependent peptidase ImmA (M78 family)